MKQRIVFFGTGDYTIPVIKSLKNHSLAQIVTTEPYGKVEKFARSQNIPYLTSRLQSEEDIKKIKNIQPTLGILASFGAIIPKEIIDIFPNGILNIHPSLLPKYKGPTPIQTTVLNGDNTTGVTVIKLDEEIDHGPIAYQVSVKLTGHETSEDLKRTLFKIGADLISQIIKGLEDGKSINYQQQNHTQESFTEKFGNEAGKINIDSPPDPQQLNKMIRALYPSPGVYTTIKLNMKEKRLKLLPKNRVQLEGKNIMTTGDFENGYGKEGKEIIEKLRLGK